MPKRYALSLNEKYGDPDGETAKMQRTYYVLPKGHFERVGIFIWTHTIHDKLVVLVVSKHF